MSRSTADLDGNPKVQRPVLPRRAAGALGALALTLTLAGCFGSGSSSSLPGSDPASILPASTLAYAQAVLRPTGTLAGDINAASKRLLGIANPGQQLDALIDKSAPAGASYEKDIRPWLGPRAGIALLRAGNGGTEYAVVLDAQDTAKAQAAVANKAFFANKGSAPDSTTRASYRGVSYTDDQTSKMVVGVVGQFVVATNSAAAFDATVDVEKGASSLASVGSYQQALGDDLGNAAGSVYVPVRKLVDLFSSSVSAGTERSLFSAVDGMIGNDVLYGSARFDASGALLDLGTLNAPSGASSSSPSSPAETNPIGSLPADSWIAVGATKIGPVLLKELGSLAKLGGSTAGSLNQSLSEIQLATGVDVRGDLSSITTAGFFVSGTSSSSVNAALVLGLQDAAKAQPIVGQLYKLATLLQSSVKGMSVSSLSQGSTSSFTLTIPGLSQPIVIAAAGGHIVVALGQSSLSAATNGTATLADSAGYKSASALLGSGIQPIAYVNLAQIGSLAQSTGTSTSTAPITELERLGSVAIGTGKIAGSEHVRVAIPGS